MHQRHAQCLAACQQAGAWHGREGDGQQSLGVVRQAMLLIGARPGPVKHIFAVGVGLDIEGAGRQQLIAVPDGDDPGDPAGIGRGAAALLHGCQVFVAHEGRGRGLRGQQHIPGLCVQLLHAGKHASDNLVFGHALIVAGAGGLTA